MTAEIAVMNRQGVALAADSAVTIQGPYGTKVFTSANKIFGLSQKEPVGIMVFGEADFMRIPWETIVKEYRSALGPKKFDSLHEYAKDFLAYLAGNRRLFPPAEQAAFARSELGSYYTWVRDEILKRVEEGMRSGETVDVSRAQGIATDFLNEQAEDWKGSPLGPGFPRGFQSKLTAALADALDEAKKDVFEDFPLTAALSRRLTRLGVGLFLRGPLPWMGSGVVIAGFGAKDVFPALESYQLKGVVENKLVYQPGKAAKITTDENAYIAPFAQSEMVATFMEGVDPSYQAMIDSVIERIVDRYPEIVCDEIDDKTGEKLRPVLESKGREIVAEVAQDLQRHKVQLYVGPVLGVAASLPKDELAAMAEALVNLTSFKRRVSMEVETVGGPIDVAVISIGDGFIWVKRKHYFDAALNPQFIGRYYG